MSGARRVLVLGAGRVSGPVYQDLAGQSDVQVTAVSVVKSELERVSRLCPCAKLECVDITNDPISRDRLMADHDVVIGLVPYSILPDVARGCLALKKHLVSASYLDEELKQLHEKAEDAGLTFLCEVGLDPGIDHMLAMRTFDDIRNRDGTVTSYQLWCGGLPAPEHADNPLKYKFSWYPRGSLWACCRGGGYKKSGKVITVPPGPGLVESAKDVHYSEEFQIEGFPNVYSPAYLDLYSIHTVDTFIRGTLRYMGFSDAVLSLIKLGLFSDKSDGLLKPGSTGFTWKKFFKNQFGLPEGTTDEELISTIETKVGKKQIETIKRLDLLEDAEVETKDTPIDTLANYLEKRPEFMFGPEERDLVLMHIEVEGRFPNGCRETRNVDMVVYGDAGGHSAMAKTVGHTVASATMLLLDGKISQRGVVLPISPGIYKPLLGDLEKKGITVTDSRK